MNSKSVLLVKEHPVFRALLRITFVAVLASLIGAITGCGSGSSSGSNPPPTNGTAPTNLAYPQTNVVTPVGQAITIDTPSVSGAPTSFTVSPALPAGLNLSASTGAISGTPTS